jgi:hypothetical protein
VIRNHSLEGGHLLEIKGQIRLIANSSWLIIDAAYIEVVFRASTRVFL